MVRTKVCRYNMPLRVGIDLTSVTAVQDSIRTHAERYLERVYTDAEVSECRTPAGLDAERLAARFAVKEAAMKVLRPTDDDAVPWNTIEVHREDSGSVDIELSGRAAELAAETGIGELVASLTHEAEFAAAVVVADVRSGAGGGDG
jgi:holo-[acyl-carrier protein] synthase